jgi:hypothetical protein
MNVPVVHMARNIMILMRAIGGVGPENRDFFGPRIGNDQSECHLGPISRNIENVTMEV